MGVLVGLFPAFYITKFNPALVLKGSFGRSKKGQRLRSILLIIQFTISIVLIIGAGFVYLQSRFMQKYDYGFNRDRLITVSVGGKIASQPQAFLSELKKNPAMEGVAYGDHSILSIAMGWGRNHNGEHINHLCLPVSWNYPEFMGLKLLEGRFFIEEDASKPGGTFIFNETAAKKYNIKVGEFMGGHSDSELAEVVGIVKDFNFASLKNGIEPLALYEFGSNGWRIPSVAHIRLSPDADFKQSADFIASCMKEVNPDINLEKIKIYPFDTEIENLYTKEQNLTKIISLFSLVAILISLMGVFGIVVFENQHRRKEIALRKIHGSTTALILSMFNRKFIHILSMSFVIAAPIAWFCVTKWLSAFAYRTPIYWWVFAGGFLVVAFITLLTVTLQTFHVANENPIHSIKAE
jgi:putative ABC transport system permease protein